jgi:hypothetical protein
MTKMVASAFIRFGSSEPRRGGPLPTAGDASKVHCIKYCQFASPAEEMSKCIELVMRAPDLSGEDVVARVQANAEIELEAR